MTIGGNRACTDGKEIHLPSLPLNAPSLLHALTLGYLYHETGHIEVTDMACFRGSRCGQSP